jgi:hypothetical protein
VLNTRITEATQERITSQDVWVNYSDSVLGAAIFDLSGLPKEYFTTADSGDISWVQTIFQALGLQSLLVSSLQLEGFHHAAIHGAGYCAVVVRQPAQYTALLVRQTDFKNFPASFIRWMQDLEPTILSANSRFNAV